MKKIIIDEKLSHIISVFVSVFAMIYHFFIVSNIDYFWIVTIAMSVPLVLFVYNLVRNGRYSLDNILHRIIIFIINIFTILITSTIVYIIIILIGFSISGGK